jgi:type II secretory pathway pseudopilin PulG
MTRFSWRFVLVIALVALAALAALGLALQADRVASERAASEAQDQAFRQDAQQFASALAAVSLPSNLAKEVPRVDGCTAGAGVSRCWTSAKSPAEVAATLKAADSGLNVTSVTERRGIPGAGGSFIVTVKAENGQNFALAVDGRNVRDQSLGEGPTIWRGSVIQALPVSE